MRASALKVEDHFISQGAQEPEAGKGKNDACLKLQKELGFALGFLWKE